MVYSEINEFAFQNASIGDLIKILVKAKLYAAANYLHDDILCLGPVPQDLPYQEHQVAQDLLKRENNTTYSIVQPCLHSNYLHMNEVTENNVSCKLLPAVGSYAQKNMHTLHGFTLDPGTDNEAYVCMTCILFNNIHSVHTSIINVYS